jgi:AcrR family transcriptional regulator
MNKNVNDMGDKYMEHMTRRDRERLVREGEIVSAAEKVFYEKGFETASMDEIAKAAQFTKRTLYQYFKNKEDLFFAVVLKGLKRLYEYLSGLADSQQCGFQKIEKTCKGYYRFLKDNPDILWNISYWSYVKKRAAAESHKKNELSEFNNIMFKSVAEVIEQGKADGSIKSEIDPDKAAFSLIFIMTGFMNQLSTTGESFTRNFSLDIEEFGQYSIDLLLGTIRNTKG